MRSFNREVDRTHRDLIRQNDDLIARERRNYELIQRLRGTRRGLLRLQAEAEEKGQDPSMLQDALDREMDLRTDLQLEREDYNAQIVAIENRLMGLRRSSANMATQHILNNRLYAQSGAPFENEIRSFIPREMFGLDDLVLFDHDTSTLSESIATLSSLPTTQSIDTVVRSNPLNFSLNDEEYTMTTETGSGSETLNSFSTL
jgi:hypothetical protein